MGEQKDPVLAKIKGYTRLGIAELRKAADAHEVAKRENTSSAARKALQRYTSARMMLDEGLAVATSAASRNDNEFLMQRRKMLAWSNNCSDMLASLENQFPSIFDKPSTSAPRPPDPERMKLIEAQIIDPSTVKVKWDDIAGLASVKATLREMVILPMKRSDLFKGLRKPARGLLLFGPPGNGKTMLAKALVAEAGATFFGISAASLTSKWFGEGEKLVRALFEVASARQPSVIFIDEIDALMSARSTQENEASRRFKSEFLVQFDGINSGKDGRIVVIGATNRPEDIDDAVRRRLVKRIYVPLPDTDSRRALLSKALKEDGLRLPSADIEQLVLDTDGYSSSDLRSLCEEAAMAPLRELGPRAETISANQVRGLKYSDFKAAQQVIRPSVHNSQLRHFEVWNEQFGSHLRATDSDSDSQQLESQAPGSVSSSSGQQMSMFRKLFGS